MRRIPLPNNIVSRDIFDVRQNHRILQIKVVNLQSILIFIWTSPIWHTFSRMTDTSTLTILTKIYSFVNHSLNVEQEWMFFKKMTIFTEVTLQC